MLSGKIKLEIEDIRSGELERAEVNEPSLISIYPFQKHTLTALEDSILIEANTLDEHKSDTFYPQ